MAPLEQCILVLVWWSLLVASPGLSLRALLPYQCYHECSWVSTLRSTERGILIVPFITHSHSFKLQSRIAPPQWLVPRFGRASSVGAFTFYKHVDYVLAYSREDKYGKSKFINILNIHLLAAIGLLLRKLLEYHGLSMSDQKNYCGQ